MAFSTKLPTNPIGVYWPYWAPVQRLTAWPTTYNVIFLFHAFPPASDYNPDGSVRVPGGTTGEVVLRTPGGTIGTNLNADIATCRARGQRIIVSVGGMGGQVYVQTQARADAFIASIKAINVQLGGSGTTAAFDGIDWNNFEGVSLAGQTTWMTYASQQLKQFYGDDFLITSPPAAFGLSTGGQAGVDRQLLATLYANQVLDWMCPQFYDGTIGVGTVRNALDFYNTAVIVNGSSVQIPRDRIGIGFGVRTPTWTDAGYWLLSDATSAYTTMVSEGKAPKGVMQWSASLDPTSTFAAAMSSVVTNNTEPLTPKFSLALSSNFSNEASTTAQLTAPSGKTSGADFQAGLISETSNPLSAIDLASGKYTEVEWNIIATNDAVTAQQYEFRVTSNGVALDTYSVTPRWTIGTPPTPPAGNAVGTSSGVGSVTGLSSITFA